MPHSSDSEAFESADEDVEIERHTKAATVAVNQDQTAKDDGIIIPNIASINLQASAKQPNIPKTVAPKAYTTAPAATETNDDGWDNWEEDDDKCDPTASDDRKPDVVPFVAAKQTDPDADGWDKWSDDDDDANDANRSVSTATAAPTATTKSPSSSNLTEIPAAPTPIASASNPVPSGGGWGSWTPWGGVDLVSNLLSTASDGVASITSHVTSAIESGIGVPGPEEMARRQRDEKAARRSSSGTATQQQQPPPADVAMPSPAADRRPTTAQRPASSDDDGTAMLFGQIVSGVTHIGSRVITGGLGTLEGIGKKTMAVLQENDPGLRNKRRMLNMDGQAPVLSQILREAKETAEQEEKSMKLVQKQQYKKQLHFETLFDDYHGLVHLEALEMLSRQSALRLQGLLAPLAGRALDDLQETLDEVKELCELPDADQLEEADGSYAAAVLADKLATAVEDLDVPVDFADIVACWQVNADWLAEQQQPPVQPQQVHDRALRCLAETTALVVHKMHKLAELLLVKDRHSTANEADALVQLVSTVCWHLGGIASRFGRQLSAMETHDTNLNDLITSTFLEGSNSISYIENGFQLFVPILQVGAA